MPAIQIDLYEALTEAGVKPDAARRVERQVELAIVSGHEASRTDLFHRLMTKEDGLQLRAEFKQDLADLRGELKQEMADLRAEFRRDITDVHKALGSQTLRIIGLVFVMNSAMLAALRYLPS